MGPPPEVSVKCTTSGASPRRGVALKAATGWASASSARLTSAPPRAIATGMEVHDRWVRITRPPSSLFRDYTSSDTSSPRAARTRGRARPSVVRPQYFRRIWMVFVSPAFTSKLDAAKSGGDRAGSLLFEAP